MNSTTLISDTENKHTLRMLKEFLRDDNDSSTIPTQPSRARTRTRTRSRAAVASFQKLLISAVKSIHIISPSSPTLQRSLSKRLLMGFRRQKKSKGCSGEGRVVTVKDILRWRSFRDEDKFPPEIATSHAAGEVSFTADELPWWLGEGKNWNNEVDVLDLDGRDLLRTTDNSPQIGPQQDNNIGNEEEKEQHSPVSVLNSPFRDEVWDEDCLSSFDQSLANVERTKQRLLESIQRLESLAGVDEQSSLGEDLEDGEVEEEEIREENGIEAKRYGVYMLKVMSRLSRGGQGLKGIEGCFKEMDKEAQWSKFGEEKHDVGQELEASLLHDLLHHLLLELTK